MENVRTSLSEARSNVLNSVRDSREGREAVAYWNPLVTTRTGELSCIQDAQAGDNKARLYLFIRSIPQLGSSLKKFLGPDYRASSARVRNGEDVDFINEAMVTLDRALSKYNPSVVSPNKSLINDFGMWIRNATMTQGTAVNRKASRGDIIGKVSKKDPVVHVGSYDAHIEAGGDDLASNHDAERDTTLLDAWGTFVDDEELDGKSPSVRDILRYFLQNENFDVNAASAEFGKTNMTIRTKLASLEPVLHSHGISYEDFTSLLRTHGGKQLAATL